MWKVSSAGTASVVMATDWLSALGAVLHQHGLTHRIHQLLIRHEPRRVVVDDPALGLRVLIEHAEGEAIEPVHAAEYEVEYEVDIEDEVDIEVEVDIEDEDEAIIEIVPRPRVARRMALSRRLCASC